MDEVTVNTTLDGMISADLKGFEIVPVKPDFTHTLEPARPVQGRVTDKQTGKPLAGMTRRDDPNAAARRHALLDPNRRRRPLPHLGPSDRPIRISPRSIRRRIPDTSTAKDVHQGWPAGAKFLEVNFALEKGRLVQGRVIDKDTKKPIAGAAVVYQPAHKNSNNTDEHDFRNTVLTDPEGKFVITALSGEGMLAVETPDESYIRTPTKGTTYGGPFIPKVMSRSRCRRRVIPARWRYPSRRA